jgi:hypothetical protein
LFDTLNVLGQQRFLSTVGKHSIGKEPCCTPLPLPVQAKVKAEYPQHFAANACKLLQIKGTIAIPEEAKADLTLTNRALHQRCRGLFG